MGQQGALARDLGPGDGSSVQPGLVRGDGDLIVLADPAALLLQPADPLLDDGNGLPGAGLAQTLGEFRQPCLE